MDKFLYKPNSFAFHPTAITHSAVGGMTARQNIRMTFGGASKFTFTFSRKRLTDMRYFRGFFPNQYGTSRPFLITICDPMSPDIANMTQDDWLFHLGIDKTTLNANGEMPFSDGTFFADGTGFAVPTIGFPSVTSAAQEGQGYLEVSNPAALPFGTYFTYDNHMYVCGGLSGTRTSIAPVLRSTIPAGTILNLNDLTVKVRLADDGEGAIHQINGKYTDTITFEADEAW